MPYYHDHTIPFFEDDNNLLLYSKMNDVKVYKIIDYDPIFIGDITEFKNKVYVPEVKDEYYVDTYFDRFFAKQLYKSRVFEISEEDYNAVNDPESIYNVVKIRWKISVTDKEIELYNSTVTRAMNINGITNYTELIDTSQQDYKIAYVKMLNYNTLVLADTKLYGIKQTFGNKLSQFYKEFSLQDVKNALI